MEGKASWKEEFLELLPAFKIEPKGRKEINISKSGWIKTQTFSKTAPVTKEPGEPMTGGWVSHTCWSPINHSLVLPSLFNVSARSLLATAYESLHCKQVLLNSCKIFFYLDTHSLTRLFIFLLGGGSFFRNTAFTYKLFSASSLIFPGWMKTGVTEKIRAWTSLRTYCVPVMKQMVGKVNWIRLECVSLKLLELASLSFMLLWEI